MPTMPSELFLMDQDYIQERIGLCFVEFSCLPFVFLYFCMFPVLESGKRSTPHHGSGSNVASAVFAGRIYTVIAYSHLRS